ncbi:MAG: TRAP transporter small permease [Peptococcaceae bacterium]|jgi:TRAP-type C4-dicarboxylate transport system permease small subunit|nr:TRAP transporter small permease [Peptococcaceae bacterium]MDH7525015.1 TRAP transporter small permease [Peptococcaceae bacterium]
MDVKKSKWSIVNSGFALIAIAAIILMGVFTTIDVIWRWFSDEPVGPVFSMCETLMAVMVFAALAPTQEAGGHISVTILTSRLNEKWRAALELVSLTVCLLFFAMIFTQTLKDGLWAYGVKSFRYGDFYRFPTWWARLFVPVGALAMMGQLVAEIKGNLYFLLKRFPTG